MTAKIAEYFPISAKIYNIKARILSQSKLNEYIIIDSQVGDSQILSLEAQPKKVNL
jgi:hypothetical protein